MKKLLLVLAIIFMASCAMAAEVVVSWDPVSDVGLIGYKVYYGTATKTYGIPIDVGNVTTYTITGLTNKTIYFIVATAYDSTTESVYSNEVSGVAKIGAPKNLRIPAK
jgi:hypothetical protein